jgi:hypothetical protein
VHGVLIAGSTEASDEHYAYAISMADVCRNISIGMGNASVHIPTPIENAITAYKLAHHEQDTVELATLYTRQLVREVAHNGSGHVEYHLPDGVSEFSSGTNSLLTLARVCPLVKPSDVSTTHSLGSLVSKLRLVMSGKSLWHELCQYSELRNIAGLVVIFFSIGPDLNAFDAAKLIQHTMTELGIFPLPSETMLGPLVRQLRPPGDLLDLTGNRAPFPSRFPSAAARRVAPKLLARLFYTMHTRRFFVYCGPLGQWLHQLSEIVELRVITITPNSNYSSMELQTILATCEEHWASQIQASVLPESQLDYYSQDVGARFSQFGNVVEHPGLRDLLWRLANNGSGRPWEDVALLD